MTLKTRLEPASEEELIAMREFLVRFWMKRGNSRSIAEEAAQEGLLQIWLKAATYEAREGFGGRTASRTSFLNTVAIRAGLTYFRKEARQGRIKRRVSDAIDVVRRR